LGANRPSVKKAPGKRPAPKQTGNLPGGSGKQATLLRNVDRADRKPRCGAELSWRQDVKRLGIRGWGE
jgi:hypothetical protein